MKLFQICFSPTGGTKAVADALAAGLSGERVFVDLTDRNIDLHKTAPSKQDLALIAVPSYAGRVPALAAERLSRIRAGGTRAIVVCVYGNRAYEDTLLELGDLALEAGFKVIAAVAAVAEHSIAGKYAAGRPDAGDLEQLSFFAFEIRRKIKSGILSGPRIPGSRPYRQAGKSAMVPQATDQCVSCGECARQCPAGAIDKVDPKTVDPKACISCMRCVKLCSVKARIIDPKMLAMIEKMLEKPCSERKPCELYI